MALGATVACDCLLQPFFAGSWRERAAGAAMSASFAVAGTRWALTREPSEWSALRGSAVTGAVVLTWFMLCNRLALLHASVPADSFLLLVLPVLLVVVAAAGALAGTLFGLTAFAVIGPVESARESTSLDAPERVMVPASVWLSAWGLGILSLRDPRSFAPLAIVVLGVSGLVFVACRDVARLRFLAHLFRGAAAGLRVVRATPLHPTSPNVPAWGPYRRDALDGFLVTSGPATGPYREPPAAPPIARLPCDPKTAGAPLRRRLLVCAALSAAIATITAALLEARATPW